MDIFSCCRPQGYSQPSEIAPITRESKLRQEHIQSLADIIKAPLNDRVIDASADEICQLISKTRKKPITDEGAECLLCCIKLTGTKDDPPKVCTFEFEILEVNSTIEIHEIIEKKSYHLGTVNQLQFNDLDSDCCVIL